MMKLAKKQKVEPKLDAQPSAGKVLAGGARQDCIAFVADNVTHDMVSATCQQLFGKSQVRDGGSREALEYLSAGSAPKVLIVDITDATKPLNALLPIIAAFIDDTKVVAIGTINDIEFYREAIDAGVADYLVKPVTSKVLTASIQRIVAPTTAATEDRKIIGVLGARGGVGGTLVSVNIAWLLAEQMRKPTTLIDLDLWHGTVALALDIEPTRGLREALEHPTRIDSLFISSACAKFGDRMHVMASEEAVDDDVHFEAGAITLLIDQVRRQSDYIVIDVPRSSPRARTRVMNSATDLVLVTDLTLASLRDVLRIQQQVQILAPNAHVFVVANRVGSKDAALPREEFERALGRKVDLILHEDLKAAQHAASAGKPLAAVAPSSKTAVALKDLVSRFGQQKQERRRWMPWRRRTA
ncbi:MAG: P-loop NTPase [Dongiaceae bacterium]